MFWRSRCNGFYLSLPMKPRHYKLVTIQLNKQWSFVFLNVKIESGNDFQTTKLIYETLVLVIYIVTHNVAKFLIPQQNNSLRRMVQFNIQRVNLLLCNWQIHWPPDWFKPTLMLIFFFASYLDHKSNLQSRLWIVFCFFVSESRPSYQELKYQKSLFSHVLPDFSFFTVEVWSTYSL